MSSNTMQNTKQANASAISLSQAILAPLDAIFKAQIHAGRSYINMLWQMAYPHIPVDDKGHQIKFKRSFVEEEKYVFERDDGTFFTLSEGGMPEAKEGFVADEGKEIDLRSPYQFPLNFKVEKDNKQQEYIMQVPAIAMIPTSPLGIEEASIKFSMSIENVTDHKQLQRAESRNHVSQSNTSGGSRPWYLVEEPKSINGYINTKDATNSSIDIEIKLAKSPIPAALEKSLTVLTQSISVTEK